MAIQGFRSFGAEPVDFDLDNAITLLEGENSHGKTSIAEALEYVLTGDITRRGMAGSAAAEFEGCLRNAHIPGSVETYVEADFCEGDSESIRVRRTLVNDTGHNSPANSLLTVNGDPVADLISTGIVLSSPPIEAPILLQHNLRYLLTARPQERMDYFKAVLELSEAENIRSAVGQLEVPALTGEASDLLSHLSEVVGESAAPAVINILQAAAGGTGSVRDGAMSLLATFAANAGIELGEHPDESELIFKIQSELDRRRTTVFPTDDISLPPRDADPAMTLAVPIEEYNTAVDTADRSLFQLLGLFEELLRIPPIVEATQAIDCPVCETPSALTPERVAAIRQHVDDSSGFSQVQELAKQSLHSLRERASDLSTLANALPPVVSWGDDERELRISEAEELGNLGEEVQALLDETPAVQSAAQDLRSRAEAAIEAAERSSVFCAERRAIPLELTDTVTAMDGAAVAFDAALTNYLEMADPVQQALSSAMSRHADLVKWESAVRVLESLNAVESLGREIGGCAVAERRLLAAKQDIDVAVQALLDLRFGEMSEEIAKWWSRLRPGDPTSFEGVERRGTGRRYLDLKTRLGTGADDSGGVVMNAVSVLSDSQLGALGLSTFLARCVKETTGFIFLDDPLAGFDDEHRTTFANATLGGLVDAGIQLILSTYDRKLAEQVKRVHDHHGVIRLNVSMNDTRSSTLVTPFEDQFEALHATAISMAKSGNTANRRTSARDGRTAAERLAKQVITGHRRREGLEALLQDLDGKQLGMLIDILSPYVLGPDELGKWRSAADSLNPGNHDADVPSSHALVQTLGDLRAFKNAHKAELGTFWVSE